MGLGRLLAKGGEFTRELRHTPSIARLLSLLLILAFASATLVLRAQTPAPPSTPTAAPSAHARLAAGASRPALNDRAAPPQHRSHRWWITAAVAAAAAIVTGIIVAHRDHSEKCHNCLEHNVP